MTQDISNDEILICRCRDVTKTEIVEAIEEGYDTMELIKRKTKIGTGTCGGRTCLPLIRRILAHKTGRRVEEIDLPRERAPIIPLPIRFAAGETAGDK